MDGRQPAPEEKEECLDEEKEIVHIQAQESDI